MPGPLSTAAGTIFRPTIDSIDRMLGCLSDRYMMMPGDVDKLLDYRLELMAGELR